MQTFCLYLWLTILIAFISCSNNDDTSDLKIGYWKLASVTDNTGKEKANMFIIKPGLQFISSSKFKYLPGPIDLPFEEQPKVSEIIDSVITYEISSNIVSYRSLKNGNVIIKEITLLSKDSLHLKDKSKNTRKYIRITKQQSPKESIDKIVLSSSGCYGSCPIINIIITKSDEVIYYCEEYCGNEGLHHGQVAKSKIDNAFDFLNFIDLDSLDNLYEVSHTDDETISISLYNGERLVKTISDYGRAAPTEFIWLYTYLRYLPGLRSLELTDEPLVEYIRPSILLLTNGVRHLMLSKSESFHLHSMLLDAEQTDVSIDLPFKIYNLDYTVNHPEEFLISNDLPEIHGYTDGRYFQFNSLKNKTFDIGYNYFENSIDQ